MNLKKLLLFTVYFLYVTPASASDLTWGTDEAFGQVGYGFEERDLSTREEVTTGIFHEPMAQMRSEWPLTDTSRTRMNVWGIDESDGLIGYSSELRQAGDAGGHVIYDGEERLLPPAPGTSDIRGQIKPSEFYGTAPTGKYEPPSIYRFDSRGSQRTIDDMMDTL